MMISKSASKIRDVKSSVQKEMKNRRSVSIDTRARGSYVPDRKRSLSDERISAGNRLTVNRWGNMRKSSINLYEGKRKDARPLTDKAYQKRKVTELVKFLEELEFSPPISITKLMSPSKKDFENIFQFLYRCFVPTYEVNKIEEEGPKILKNLGYPFTLNKSAFVYVARTNWPSLLGVLIWLMDLNKFFMKIDLKKYFETPGEDERSQKHKILLRYICQCHHSGIDNEEEENAVFEQIIKSCISENLDELVEKNEEKKMFLASVEEKINELKQLAVDRDQLDVNIVKYDEFILKMQSHYEKKKELIDQLMKEKEQKESKLKALEQEVSKMQDLYDAQGFDGKKHMTYFEAQKKDLADKLEKKRTFVKELKDKYWEAEIENGKITSEAAESSKSAEKQYNEMTESLKRVLVPLSNTNIPQVQKLCNNFVLEFPSWESNAKKHSVEHSVAFRKAVDDIVEKIKSTDEILNRIKVSINKKLTEIEMKKNELSTMLKLVNIKENKQEQDLDSKIKIADDEISLIESQIEKVVQAVKALQDEKKELERECREMIEEKNILTAFREKKEKELKEFLVYQKELFSYFEKNEEELVHVTQNYGKEILEVVDSKIRKLRKS